jgi:xanthine dehydrogenase/oxidase
MRYPLGYFGTTYALVSIYHGDGSVSISVGGIEMGQGLNTKVAQTASHILGIPLDKISVKPSNTHTAPNAICTGGSTGSDICSFAVQKACEKLIERLKPIKDKNPNIEWSALIDKATGENVDLSEKYMYKPDDIKTYIIWGASCCEIEVDILTGNILIKRVDIMEDVGESMSPGIDIGQIEGGFVMGLGYWLTESIIYDQVTGELLTNRTWNYKPPGAKDIPIDFRINFLKNSSNPFGVLRSKGIKYLIYDRLALTLFSHSYRRAKHSNGCSFTLCTSSCFKFSKKRR